jgi:phosphatidyl-myo-inositol dimannoside synthase
MRVLCLVTDAYGGHGGIALYTRDLIEAVTMIPEVTEVDVVPRTRRFAAVGIPPKVRFFDRAIGSRLRFVWTALCRIVDRPNLIICSHINLLPVATLLSILLRRPIILVVYGIEVWQRHGAFTRWMGRRAVSIWSISEVTRDRMNRWIGLPNDRYAIIPNAIRLENYGEGSRDSALLEKWNLPPSCTLLLTVARLSSSERYKGIDEVISTLPDLLKTHPNTYYVVAGDGDDRTRLEQVARTCSVEDRVRFVGYVSESEKLSWLRSASAFVMPGRGEGFGFVYLEALACGTPAVGSTRDGSSEALLHGQLGPLAEPDSRGDILAKTLIALKALRSVPIALHTFSFTAFREKVRTAFAAFSAY